MPDIAERLASALDGRYRIERELGAGGMATVYLADDLRHGRRVAIKLLHPELSAVLGPDRFLGEIRTTAGLQHPHILPLFDSGSAEGLLYYVMPYVEGETLRRRLLRERQLPVADAIRLATETADALEYAHRNGVIHRDIKPENILLQGEHALVADFGIALAVQQAGGSRLTQTGLSLGTPQYMAPEQATGEKHVDARADVYALGAVMYEMLAGEPPFAGPTAQAIVAKVITERPRPLREVRETVSGHVASAVHAALQKLPADRPASAAEFARLLGSEGTMVLPAASPGQESRGRRVVPWAVGLVAAALAAGGGYALGHRSATPSRVMSPPSRLAILTPTLGGTGVPAIHRQIALTPDGSGIVFVALLPSGGNGLAYQSLDAQEPILVQGGARMVDPLISPDGRRMMVYGALDDAGGTPVRAYRLPLKGGTPAALPVEADSRWAGYTSDGGAWFTVASALGLYRLTPDNVVKKSAFFERTVGLRLQQVLDGDRRALMIRSPQGSGSGPVLALDLETGEETALVEVPAVEARYTAGHLVYVGGDGVLWAVPYDERANRLGGDPVQIATGVSLTGTSQAQIAVASNGTVAFIPEEPRSLFFADRAGSFRPAVAERHSFHAPKFSPDGRRVSVDFPSADGRDIWILSQGQGTLTRATFDRDAHDATWTHDGRFLTYTSFKSGAFGIYRARPGVDAPAESLIASPQLGYTGQWLPDGSGLVTVGQGLKPGSGPDIALVANGGRGPIEPVVATSFQTQYPALSPDGHWLAYVSDQSGGQQVFVRRLSGVGEEIQVSQQGGTEPLWAPGGHELFYRATAGDHLQLMAAELRLTPEPEVESRRMLFSLDDVVGSQPHSNYDISPDGKTFVMIRRSPATRIVVLQNLPELVRHLREANSATQ
ncbi:MAG TPA: protein kinase [Gemmatimonadales bacterium]|jgi:serine/threonine-protein kinase